MITLLKCKNMELISFGYYYMHFTFGSFKINNKDYAHFLCICYEINTLRTYFYLLPRIIFSSIEIRNKQKRKSLCLYLILVSSNTQIYLIVIDPSVPTVVSQTYLM